VPPLGTAVVVEDPRCSFGRQDRFSLIRNASRRGISGGIFSRVSSLLSRSSNGTSVGLDAKLGSGRSTQYCVFIPLPLAHINLGFRSHLPCSSPSPRGLWLLPRPGKAEPEDHKRNPNLKPAATNSSHHRPSFRLNQAGCQWLPVAGRLRSYNTCFAAQRPELEVLVSSTLVDQLFWPGSSFDGMLAIEYCPSPVYHPRCDCGTIIQVLH
jgi:hypothetical protein